MWKKWNSINTGGDIEWCNHFGKGFCGFLIDTTIEGSHSLLDIYLGKYRPIQRHIGIFIAALFIPDKTENHADIY